MPMLLRLRRCLPVVCVAMLTALTSTAGAEDEREAGWVESIDVKVRIPGADSVELRRYPDSRYIYRVYWKDRPAEELDAQQFAQVLFDEHTGQPFIYQLFNISSPWGFAWVSLGLLGQVLFTGRMLVQWLASEKSKKSVVPVAFWWMSLIGASMLLVYFIWRKDIVGVLGQGAGWIIYIRNLMLIAGHKAAPAAQEPRTQ